MNHKYFHACLKKRRIHNQVCRIKDVNGVWKEQKSDIDDASIQYYKQILGIVVAPDAHMSTTILKEGNFITNVQQQMLCEKFIAVEVKEALWDIEDNKSPGPNVYNIYDDVSHVVLNFISSGKLLKHLNATTLCLIPKVYQPSDVSQFLPITCCNVLYKII